MRTQEVVSSFMADCKLRGLSDRTLEEYNRHTRHLIEASPEFPPRAEIIQEFLANVKGAHNRFAYFRTYRALSNYGHRRFKTKNFMKSVTRPRVQKRPQPVLSDLNLELLAWRMQSASLRDKALIMLLIDSACRSGEAATLKRADIQNDCIVVHGKTGFRVAPLSAITRDVLLSLPAYDDGYVFHGMEGTRYANRPLGKTGTYKIVRRYLHLCGYDAGRRYGPQTLRITHGVAHLRSGGNMRALQLIMGHSDIKTTANYYTPLAREDVIKMHHEHTPIKVFEEVA